MAKVTSDAVDVPDALSAVAQQVPVRAGDTPESLAQTYLGDAAHAQELLLFNRLSRKAFTASGPGQLILIPGEVRLRAIKEMEAARTLVQAAQDAGAKRYAGSALAKAEVAMKNAQEALAQASYDQAGHFAHLTSLYAERTQAVANLKARIDETLACTPSAADGRDALEAGGLLQAQDLTPHRITLPDGGEAFLYGSSSLGLVSNRVDRRNGLRQLQLRLDEGMVDLRIAKPKHEASRTQLLSNQVALFLEPGNYRLRCSGDLLTVSVLEGSAVVSDVRGTFLSCGKGQGLAVQRGRLLARSLEQLHAAPLPRPFSDESCSDLSPVLQWSAGEGEGRPSFSYFLEVARDKAFMEPVQVLWADHVEPELDLLAPGKYFWRVSAASLTGVMSPSSATMPLEIAYQLEVDWAATPPPCMRDGQSWISAAHRISVSPKREASSVQAVEVSKDGGEYRPLKEPLQLTRDGRHELRFRGVAEDGQAGKPVQATVFVDQQGPQVRVLFSPAAEEGADHLVLLLAEDPVGVLKVEYALGKEPFAPYREAISWNPERDGPLRYRAHDAVGNVSPIRQVFFKTER